MCNREGGGCYRLGRARLAALVVSALLGCGGTEGRVEPPSGPQPPPLAPQAADAGAPQERSATRFEARPCTGETAIPPEVDRILTELESDTRREHCELHVLGPDQARRLFVRTMNTVAHDDEGDPLPACIWEVFAIPPQAVRHLGTLSVCEFAIEKGCIYDLDQPQVSTPSLCIDADGRLGAPGG
jgi:hypothetical protein